MISQQKYIGRFDIPMTYALGLQKSTRRNHTTVHSYELIF